MKSKITIKWRWNGTFSLNFAEVIRIFAMVFNFLICEINLARAIFFHFLFSGWMKKQHQLTQCGRGLLWCIVKIQRGCLNAKGGLFIWKKSKSLILTYHKLYPIFTPISCTLKVPSGFGRTLYAEGNLQNLKQRFPSACDYWCYFRRPLVIRWRKSPNSNGEKFHRATNNESTRLISNVSLASEAKHQHQDECWM